MKENYKNLQSRRKTLLFIKSNTFTIYKSKPNKKILLLSSKRKSIKIEKTDKRIPETIRFYNIIKFGVNITNQMARKYSVMALENLENSLCRFSLQSLYD
ncbi:piggyBac transposable element-derived protein 4-like [Vespula squamosa]|uniref:PiggyBac transposable element-derived protein 4-like n=1 Tax=Vespula squamosa TaxID=30214 RepID=A0ABD2BWB1_VESSQ